MKPKDLKAPFSWEERRPLLQDGVFYVPNFYDDHAAFSLPEWEEFFANQHPVAMEYCSGNGDWVLEQARGYPQINWVAVELRFDRVRKIWAKMRNQGIKNLLIVSGEAQQFTRHYVSNHSIQDIYINFPDPWPKKRHAKHRLIQPAFLAQMRRILTEKGNVTFVTDDTPYLKWAIDHFSHTPSFSPLLEPPFSKENPSEYGYSWFEKLWRSKGKTIHYTQWTTNSLN